ncbi:MAG: beta-propeller domain-containing protein [Ruminococcus sp.]|nr:beta-propeller domain-containing protein [Ruminococcus sp.]
MKTDYEFIRDKFDESGVNAPENMDEKFVLDKINDIEPKKNKSSVFTGLTMAAAVAVFTLVAFAVSSVIGNTPKPVTITGTTASLQNFKSSDDIKKALREIYKERPKTSVSYNGDIVEEYAYNEKGDYLSNLDSAAGSGTISSKIADYGHNTTYTQYTNVDEADTVKTDGTYIYYRENASEITVFSAEGKNSKKVAEIRPKSSHYSFSDFYIHENKLIAVEDYYMESVINGTLTYGSLTYSTMVEVFDISNIKNVKRLDSFTQSGSYCSSRMIGGMMYVVSNHTAYDENDLPYAYKDKGATDDEAKKGEIPCEDIYTVMKPSNANFLVVSGIDTDKGAQATKTKAILGSADTVYCNTEHLFVTAAEYDVEKYKTNSGDFFYGLNADYTQIIKVDLNNDLSFTATAKVDGYIDNQYALDEKDGYLRVATTTDRNDSGNRIQSNRLYIFDKNLKQIGKTKAFAENESIKAVRYIGDTAYVITYEETDPLFVIDTKDVKNPKILGEVKISGFSTMLVPVDDNTLLGIGYHTQDEDDDIDMEIEEGLKLVLFDVSDKANPKVLDEKIFRNYGSQVQYNPKALLVNFERNDYTIPYSHWIESDEDYAETKYGVINFKVDNKKLKIVDEYTSEKFVDTEEEYSELERCAYAGNYIYMLGSNENIVNSTLDVTAEIDAVKYK